MRSNEFEQHALAMIGNGYSPLPIAAGEKYPGRRSPDGSWDKMSGWQKWCREQPNEFTVAGWMRMLGESEDVGLGVACGRGLICVDIDLEEAVAPLLAILPPSTVQKKGRKGVSLFYRGNTEKIRSKNFRTSERVGLLDLLAEGKQTVTPPSIHPDTGEPYYWCTEDTLLNTYPEDLTELPDDIADQIAEVLKQFGYDRERERQEVPARDSTAPSSRRSDGDGLFRKINNLALANLHAWVPHLTLRRCYRAGNGYKAVAEWRSSGSGRAFHLRSANLSLMASGIRDFGDGRGYSPIDTVMAALHLECNSALAWLGERVDPEWNEPLIVLTTSRKPRP